MFEHISAKFIDMMGDYKVNIGLTLGKYRIKIGLTGANIAVR